MKKNSSSSKSNPRKNTGSALQLDMPFSFTKMQDRIIGAALVALGIAAGLLYLMPMQAAAGMIGFPIDDSWIHLRFAENLRQFGAWSYYHTEMVTSGSSSPLLVLLISGIGAVFQDSVLVSIWIGIISFALLPLVVYRIGKQVFRKEQWLALAAAAAVLLTPKLQSAAVSGMGTMPYALLVAAAVLLYIKGKPACSMVVSSLALWMRPEALVLLAALGATRIIERYVAVDHSSITLDGAPQTKKDWLIRGIVATALVAGYGFFNLSHGSGLLPNSVPAKIAYFSKLQTPGYPGILFVFFASSVMGVLLMPALIELVTTFVLVVRRKTEPLLFPAVILLGTIIAHGIVMPMLPDGGRTMLPVTPLFIIIGIAGIRTVFRALLRTIAIPSMKTVGNALTFVVLAGVAVSGLARWQPMRDEHYNAVKSIADREVAAGKWISDNLPADAIVATHLPGALGWFGNRRIMDFSGVESPEVTSMMGDLAALQRVFEMRGVKYIAARRERFEVVNANPVYTSDPANPEVLEVTPFDRNKSHIMPQQAAVFNYQASMYMQRGQYAPAIDLLRQSYRLDPVSARTISLTGVAVLLMKDTVQALQLFEEALRLQPDYAPAMTPIADIKTAQGKLDEALALLERSIAINPKSNQTQRSLKLVRGLLTRKNIREQSFFLGGDR
jgi:hypothetical protein